MLQAFKTKAAAGTRWRQGPIGLLMNITARRLYHESQILIEHLMP
jgi:hypothetical protein